jgi:hypothetical protein
MTRRDWSEWHLRYDAEDSDLSRRLRVVQARIRQVLDTAPPGPVRAISLCAGDGRDLLGVLADHPRRADVSARLIELNPALAANATATAADLPGVEVVTGDAAATDLYAGAVPADLVLICGVFGNVIDADVRRIVAHCGQLCRTGGTIIWTRHRKPPDLVSQICEWFAEHDFQLDWLSEPDAGFGVGAHRFMGTPQPLAAGRHLFDFVR